MKSRTLLLTMILLAPLPALAQTSGMAPDAPQSSTTVVVPGDQGSATTSTTSQIGTTDTTITNVKREDGSTTTVITQQPQSTYQPMGSGGYRPMGQ
jgi:hypothetical protein